ncbi:hypothetical protein AB0C27_40340 [Nonomuraea sp. NPDC048882]|uniref:hypothetical protein n=1 Tax=Nonomuraea sp. NPDC048882 TaxID=3154347 RepID=UPI0033E3A5FB
MASPDYQPRAGDRIRVTRRRNGRTHFVKTGVVTEVCLPHGYRWTEDEGGRRFFLATSEQVATMPGYSQTIERIS